MTLAAYLPQDRRAALARGERLPERKGAATPALIARITAKAQGNPLYVEELQNYLRDRGIDKAMQSMIAVGPLPIEMQDATQQRALRAAEVKVKYRMYYADAFAAALAIEHKATLVTGDNDFRKLGQSFPVVWLKA